MDQTVRARAFTIESEARQMAPATAINALAVRYAQLEARLVAQTARAESAERELASYRTGQPRQFDGSFEPFNTLVEHDGSVG